MNIKVLPVSINPLYVVGALLVLYSIYRVSRPVSAAIDAGEAFVTETVNPVNHNNYFNRAFNSTMAAVTGNDYQGFSFGSWLSDKLHPVDSFGVEVLD